MNIENQLSATSSRISSQLSWTLTGIVFSMWMVTNPAIAQSIVTDGTTNTQINGNCAGSCQITGTDIDQGNNNLFHSFQKFNVDTGATVTFIDPGVANIITRVTGGNLSQIDGTLGVIGGANLFLINPSGIIFGQNASLNIGGSFVATSADSLVFNNGQQFSAINPTSPPLLSINVPVGLQFGANPRPIEVQGAGNNLLFNPDSTINRDLRPEGLKVPSGNTLALLGGNILLDGGNLTAEAGRIELGSVSEGFLGINSINGSWSFDYSGISSFNDVQLSGASSADVSGNNAGVIEVRGRNINLSDGSSLLANVLAKGGGEINLRAEETISLVGSSFDPARFPVFIPSSVYVEIEKEAFGDGSSSLNVFANDLKIEDGAQIGLSMAGDGNGGFLNISVKNDVILDGGRFFGPSSIFVATLPVSSSMAPMPAATGKGGELSIDTKNLKVLNGAQIIASTFDPGDAGNLSIKAEDIQVVGFNPGGPSSIVSASERPPSGKGGNIEINTQKLIVTDGGQISTATRSFRETSSAGNLVINASESIELRGQVEQGRSGLFANTFSFRNPETGDIIIPSLGEGGSITVNTPKLIVQDGATINVSNNASNPNLPTVAPGFGGAGNLEINADSIVLDNQSILTAETVKGDKGNINLKAQNIQLLNGSIISTNAIQEASGGNIGIITDNIDIRENSRITSNASGEGSSGTIAIFKNSDSSLISLDRGQITSNGGDGNILLSSSDIILRNNSLISANGTGTSQGGNVIISTRYLSAVPKENSDITANAENSFGGRVIISARGVVGIQFREQQTPLSDITVTSELGPAFSGVVEIRNENIDPQGALVELPNEVVDTSTQIAKGCSAERGNVFTVTGRGGLPENPNQTLQGRNLWQDLRPVESKASLPTSQKNQQQNQNKGNDTFAENTSIIEAQELIVDAQGKIQLVAQAPEAQTPNTWHQSQCNISSKR